jgi:hypothetical protein
MLPPARAKRKFEKFINHQVLSGLQPKAVPGIDWPIFLTNLGDNKDDILTLAAGTDSPKSPWHAVQVISRAFLLLRISTGSSEGLITRLPAGAAAGLDFWVAQIGEDRSLWSKNARPAQSVDLWIDTEDAINEIDRNLVNIDSFKTLWRTFPSAAAMLTSWERVCLWGLRI